MKNLKSFESAAKFMGIDPNKLPEVSQLPTEHQRSVIAFYMLTIISMASWKQEGKKINWSERKQYKYFPWFNSGGSFSGFSYYGCDYGRVGSGVGSRLVYPTSKIAIYVSKTHLQLYRDFMVIAQQS